MNIEFLTDNTQYIDEVLSFIDEWNNDLDYIEIKTSGSTGKPKLIMLKKEYMVASAKMTGEFLNLKRGNIAFLCLSPNTVAGKMMIVRSIVLDLQLLVTDVVSTPLKKIDKNIDFVAMVPLQVQNSLKDLNKVNKLIVGGGVISNQLWKSISDLQILAYHTFGMTETISHIAMREISADFSNYIPLKGVVLKTVDDCLNISAPRIGVENLQTNDIVQLEGDGSFIWLGRKDFVVNSGGVKLHPELIESKLENFIHNSFFTIGIPDEQLGEKLILCIEGKVEVKKNDFVSVLDKFEIPKEIYYFKKFATTESGKINRIKTIERIKGAERKIL